MLGAALLPSVSSAVSFSSAIGMLAGLRLLRLQQTHYTHYDSSDEPSPAISLCAMCPHGVALGSWLAHLHPAPASSWWGFVPEYPGARVT